MSELLRQINAQQRKRAAQRSLLKALVAVVALVGLLVLSPFLVMIALGVLHREGVALPALGFWDTWLVCLGFWALRGGVGRAGKGAVDGWKKGNDGEG